jgi:hypothetical protein
LIQIIFSRLARKSKTGRSYADHFCLAVKHIARSQICRGQVRIIFYLDIGIGGSLIGSRNAQLIGYILSQIAVNPEDAVIAGTC